MFVTVGANASRSSMSIAVKRRCVRDGAASEMYCKCPVSKPKHPPVCRYRSDPNIMRGSFVGDIDSSYDPLMMNSVRFGQDKGSRTLFHPYVNIARIWMDGAMHSRIRRIADDIFFISSIDCSFSSWILLYKPGNPMDVAGMYWLLDFFGSGS